MSELGGLTVTPAQPAPNVMDKLVSAFDEPADAPEEAVEPAPGSPQPRQAPAKKPREEVPEEDEGDVPDAAAAFDGDEGEGDEGEHEPESTRGTQEDPYSVKELPDDRYIEIKVDGEKKAVSLREMAEGYTRTEAFNKRVNQTQLLTKQAQEVIAQASAFPQKFQQQFREFTQDPQQIYEFFLATPEREKVFVEAATALARHARQVREDPEYRVRYQRERDEARLRQKEEAFEAQRKAEMQAKQAEHNRQQWNNIFNPGWTEGLKKAGFPKLDKQTHAKLFEEVKFRCIQRAQSGGSVTSEDVADFTARAARSMDLPTAKNARPAPAPVTKKSAEKPANRRDWSKASSAEKKRSPEFFLSGVKTRDLLGR